MGTEPFDRGVARTFDSTTSSLTATSTFTTSDFFALFELLKRLAIGSVLLGFDADDTELRERLVEQILGRGDGES